MTLFRPATFLMVQYAHYHRDRRNIATHLVGIPLIFLSIGVLLLEPTWVIEGETVSLAWMAWALTSVWYLTRGDLLLGLATTLVNGALIALAHQVPDLSAALGLPVWQTGVALFVISKGGDSLDMSGEKHGADAVHTEPAKAKADAAAPAASEAK